MLDESLPDKTRIVQKLALVSGSVLAHATYDAAVTIDPHGLITLRKGAHLIRQSFEDHRDLDPGRWPGAT